MQVHDVTYTTHWTYDTDEIGTMLNGNCGVGCYTCGGSDFTEGLWNSGGVAVCLGCALKYEAKGIPAELILNDQQSATLQEWEDLGIGAN